MCQAQSGRARFAKGLDYSWGIFCDHSEIANLTPFRTFGHARPELNGRLERPTPQAFWQVKKVYSRRSLCFLRTRTLYAPRWVMKATPTMPGLFTRCGLSGDSEIQNIK